MIIQCKKDHKKRHEISSESFLKIQDPCRHSGMLPEDDILTFCFRCKAFIYTETICLLRDYYIEKVSALGQSESKSQ